MKKPRYILEAASVIIVLAILASFTIPQMLHNQTRDLERRIHEDIMNVVNHFMTSFSLIPKQVLYTSTLPHRVSRSIFESGALRGAQVRFIEPLHYSEDTLFSTAFGREQRSLNSSLLSTFHSPDDEWVSSITLYSLHNFRSWRRAIERNLGESIQNNLLFFTDEYKHYPFIVALYKNEFPAENEEDNQRITVVQVFVPWPGTGEEPLVRPTDEVINHFLTLDHPEINVEGTLKSTSVFYHPSNGLNSQGYVYYDSMGNSSYNPDER